MDHEIVGKWFYLAVLAAQRKRSVRIYTHTQGAHYFSKLMLCGARSRAPGPIKAEDGTYTNIREQIKSELNLITSFNNLAHNRLNLWGEK